MPNHFIAFWNLENLFAPEGFANREPWIARQMKSSLNGWTQALFDTKIDQLASIIRQMNAGQGPDLLGVCEVENAFVLQQLTAQLNDHINNRSYAVAHVDSTRDFRGIDTAFVFDSSKYSVDPNTIFSHFVMRRTGTRDITQITLTTAGGKELVAICNHWLSRSGGAYESRGYRMTAGETLSYWHQRIWEERGNAPPVIAMGDFNDDPFDESIQIHAQATRERGGVERAQSAVRFYNLAWRYLEHQAQDHNGNAKQLHGTLYHRGNGHVIDQLLASKGLLIQDSPITVIEDTARIEVFPEMVDHRAAYGPIRFGLPKGNAAKNVNTAGFSDHFPISVVVQEQ